MENKPSEEELRSMLSEGQTLYQISRQFNIMIKEVHKLKIEYDITRIHKIPIPTKQDLESMYIDEGMTQYQISREFNVARRTVGIWLSKYNISTNRIPPKEVLEKMYSEDGMTQEQIASEFDVSYVTVGRWLRYYNIPTIVPMPPKDELLNYIAEGLNQHQIAEKCNVSDATIFNWCEYYGIPGMVNGFRCTTPEHHEWKFAVFDRDHRTCQKCGATNTMMQAHHIVPYADHPEIGYELDNGITLCEYCHKSIRGREYDYLEQFAAITQPHLRDHEVIESMPWEAPLPPLSDKLFPDYQHEVIA